MAKTRSQEDDPAPQWFSRWEEANDQRLSRLEAMVADLLCRSRKGKKENPEDQICNDEELAEIKAETKSSGIEDRAVENEANSKMISAIVKEESIPQFLMVTEADSTCVQHTNVILQQVSISPLEHSLNFCKANLDVMGNCQYAMGKTHQIWSDSNFGCVNDDACQVFDVIPMRTKVLPKEHKERFHKSWRFKFKHRVASRESKAGFEVNMKHNQSKEMLLQLLLSGTHKKRQRKTPKYHKSWKFRFKNMDLQRIMTQLDTQHFIFRWDSECILHLSTVVHHLETSPKQSSLAIDALTDFGVDVIIFHGEEQQLGCRVVMLHFTNKGRVRRFQSFSRLNNAERSLKVSKLERKKKKLCYKTWMFKYKVDEEGQGILQSRTGWVQEVFAVICFLLRRHLHLNLDCEESELAGRKRNQGLFIRLHNKRKQQRCPKSWMFKFKTNSKSARTNHILLQEKKPSKSPKSWKFKFKLSFEDTNFSVKMDHWCILSQLWLDHRNQTGFVPIEEALFMETDADYVQQDEIELSSLPNLEVKVSLKGEDLIQDERRVAHERAVGLRTRGGSRLEVDQGLRLIGAETGRRSVKRKPKTDGENHRIIL